MDGDDFLFIKKRAIHTCFEATANAFGRFKDYKILTKGSSITESMAVTEPLEMPYPTAAESSNTPSGRNFP